MKNLMIIALCVCLAAFTTSCSRRGGANGPAAPQNQSLSDDDSVSANQGFQPIEPEHSTAEASIQDGEGSSGSDGAEPENTATVSVINVNKTIEAFDMKENDAAYGWTLTEIKSYETPSDAEFYGVLTFHGEVALSGIITHVNAIYDGFDFIPDEESRGRMLIADGNPEKDFFVTIVNADEASIAEELSGLAVNESGEYIVVMTQYSFAYVPMMATNNAVVSKIEKR